MSFRSTGSRMDSGIGRGGPNPPRVWETLLSRALPNGTVGRSILGDLREDRVVGLGADRRYWIGRGIAFCRGPVHGARVKHGEGTWMFRGTQRRSGVKSLICRQHKFKRLGSAGGAVNGKLLFFGPFGCCIGDMHRLTLPRSIRYLVVCPAQFCLKQDCLLVSEFGLVGLSDARQ